MIIGSEIIFKQNIPSTNTYISELLRTGPLPTEGTIIYTNFQSAGRGQMGNKWESEDGMNILCSIVLYPDWLLPEDQFLISLAVSLGICEFLSEEIPGCKIKWPNDIYTGNDKIAGVLIENTLSGNKIENSIVGIGLNVNQTKFISDAPNPVSLKMITGKDYDIEKNIRKMAVFLDKRYKQLIVGANEEIHSLSVKLLYRRNEWHKYKIRETIFKGKIDSVTKNGHLIVIDQSGKALEFASKEIEFIL